MNSFKLAEVQVVKSDIDLTKIKAKADNQGECSFKCSLGIPTDLAKGKIRCIVEVIVGEGEPDGLKLYVKSICLFNLIGEIEQDTLRSDAEKECVTIALAETTRKIAELTKVLTGKPLNIPPPIINK